VSTGLVEGCVRCCAYPVSM